MKLKDIINQLANRINQPYVIEVYLRQVYAKGFVDGTKKSPWISVKERLPEEGDPVLIRLKDGVVRLACYDIEEDSNIYFWNDNYSYETIRAWDVTHWMPIPSFDEILEANKDVLKRIKEKGD
jgi:hypothetical protein|nr:hypothetical protein AUSP0033_00051 [uncultured phage]